MSFIALFTGFWATEVASYFLHRYLFHGKLWFIHKSHHSHREGTFEHNDFFSFFFSALSISLIIGGFSGFIALFWAWFGGGIAVYGLLYFVIHDLMTHRRFLPLKPKGLVISILSRAHLIHHQSHDKPGQEPYGLFLVHPELVARLKKRLHK